ncbi:ABC transporter ATP-binding protein/permease [Lentilactobacillus diolivorans]|uniref:ABC transporter ATP-binding protein n=1 Tax=Lentilactobacillus diolivorans TaxID=179838 RepID=UPI00246836FB|nr:ABC transporter ATP-binding protein [Lentilactobacillus diolivorans]MDH5106222.1 ABC transporter ATP-binding protein/permease [Lentilactobacillus diolivorans]
MKKYVLLHKSEMAMLSGLIVLIEALTVYGSVLNADILNALIAHNFAQFMKNVALLLTVWLLVVLTEYIEGVYQEVVIQNIDISIRNNIAKLLIRKSYSEYNAKPYGVYESWINNDIQVINEQGLSPLFVVIQGAVGTVFAVLTLIKYHWSLALVALVLAGLIILLPKIFDKKLAEKNLKLTQGNERFVNRTQDVLSAFNLLYAFQTLHLLVDGIKESSKLIKTAYVNRSKFQIAVQVTGFMGNVVSQVILIGLSGILAFQKLVKIGTINAVGSLAGNIFNSLGNMSNFLGMIRGTRPIFAKYPLIDDQPADTDLRPHAKQLLTAPAVLQTKDLSFSYDAKKPILNHVNLTFLRNKKYLILGESGAGKSTLLKLLAGYIPGYQGQILLDGMSLTEYRPAEISRRLLYLDQSPQVLQTTVRNNLSLGAQFSDQQLIEALLKMKLIQSTDEGKDYLNLDIGESGKNFSGGQIQRLALARGLIREIPVMLIDEGTSAIDEQTAVQIEMALLKNPKLTLIMISHTPHPQTEKLFDKVIHFS